jgi:hypothetical protein
LQLAQIVKQPSLIKVLVDANTTDDKLHTPPTSTTNVHARQHPMRHSIKRIANGEVQLGIA